MEDSEEMAWTRLNQPPAPPRRGRRWLLIGSLAFAFMLALGVGAIVAKTASGSSVTIHTTASTRYTQAGNTVAASAIKVGTRIHIMGTHNSDGSITATSIDVG